MILLDLFILFLLSRRVGGFVPSSWGDNSATRTFRLYANEYDQWASDGVARISYPLTEENVKECLELLMDSDYGAQMFGRHKRAASIGITGTVELAEVDGPVVNLSLHGEFWHKRSTVLGKAAIWLNACIPEIMEVNAADPEQLEDFEDYRDEDTGELLYVHDKRAPDFNGDRGTMEYQGIDPDVRGPFPPGSFVFHVCPVGLSQSTTTTIRPVSSALDATAKSSTAAAIVTTQSAPLGDPVCLYHQVTIPTSQEGPPRQAVAVEDLTAILQDLLRESGMQQGVVHVISRHTTTAVTINERESRLARDIESVLLELVPPDERSESVAARAGVRYLHNDIDERPESAEEAQRCRDNGWNIDKPDVLQHWRDQEPINAHSHLLSMILGSSEAIPVAEGNMVIGQWQSVLLVDLDGPRERTVGVQLMGYK